jgi:DNA-binding CsgD family transcriptional regulator
VWRAARFRALIAETRSLAVHAAELAPRLGAPQREAERWRQEAGDLIAGLSEAIDRQLDRWGLSPAEKDVALLLLKGLSHKEIGRVRDVSEATVRQQARALYQKAGLGGRHDLAAFFLEDLLDPRPAARASTVDATEPPIPAERVARK